MPHSAETVSRSTTTSSSSSSRLQQPVDPAEVRALYEPSYIANFTAAMNAVMPNWTGMVGQLSSTIEDMASGQLPADVARYVSQVAAETGAQRGLHGQIADFSEARTLGLTSLAMAEKGVAAGQDMLDWAGRMAPRVDIAGIVATGMNANAEAARLRQQESQYARSLAESSNSARFAATLNHNAEMARLAETARQFDANLNWDRELSGWNRNFEKWSATEQNRLMELAMSRKDQNAAIEASAFSDSLSPSTGGRSWGEPINVGTTIVGQQSASRSVEASNQGQSGVAPRGSGVGTISRGGKVIDAVGTDVKWFTPSAKAAVADEVFADIWRDLDIPDMSFF